VNVDTTDAPLTRKAGERPVWSERDIDDVAAFLTMLTDGYDLKAKAVKVGGRKRDGFRSPLI
jgi:cytochrome c peroxidase